MASETGEVRLAAISDQPLSVERVERAVADPRSGGTALFVGAVRSHDHGRVVTALTYEAHPSAGEAIAAVAAAVAAEPRVVRWPPSTASARWGSVTWPSSSPCPARTGATRSRRRGC